MPEHQCDGREMTLLRQWRDRGLFGTIITIYEELECPQCKKRVVISAVTNIPPEVS